MFLMPLHPLDVLPFIQVPFTGKLDRKWAKMAGVKVEGMWCIFHPLSQTGDPRGEVGMMSEEAFHIK